MITATVELSVIDVRAVVDYQGRPEWEISANVPWSKHPINPKLYLKREEDAQDSPWDFPADGSGKTYRALLGRGDLLKDKETKESKNPDLVWSYRYKLLQFPLSDDAPLSQTTNWYKDIFCGIPGHSPFPSESSIDPVVQAIEGGLVEDVLEEEKAQNPYGHQPTADYRQAQIMYQAARHDAIALICAFPDTYLDVESNRSPYEIRTSTLKLTNAIFREYWEDMIKPRFPDTVWEETL